MGGKRGEGQEDRVRGSGSRAGRHGKQAAGVSLAIKKQEET